MLINTPLLSQINAGSGSDTICSVTYEVGGSFFTQGSSGSAVSFPNPAQEPVIIYKITYAPGTNGNCATDARDIYPRRNLSNVAELNPALQDGGNPPANSAAGALTPTTYIPFTQGPNPPGPFINNLNNILSIPDLRSYWSINAGGLPGSGFVNFLEFQILDEVTSQPTFFDPSELLLITERDGNSPMQLQALDIDGNTIGSTVNITGTPLYEWNTTIEHDVDSFGDQPQWLLLFQTSQFGTTDNIYGFDINLQSSYADGSVLGFRNPGTLLLNGECWRMLSSSPFQNTSYADILDPIWTQGLQGADYTGGESNVLLWDNTVSGNSGGWTTNFYNPNTELNLNNAVPTGTGFLVSVFEDDNYDASGGSGFPKELSVEGVENSGTITITDSETNPELTGELNTNDEGWTLVGNPYGAPIDFSEVLANSATSGITSVAYVYDRNFGGTGGSSDAPTNGNIGGWRATSTSVGGFDYGDISNGNGLIAPFQGFFIQNDIGTSNRSITFEENDRSSLTFDPNIANNPDEWDFYGKEKSQTEDFIRFELNGEGLYNSAWVILSENGASSSRMKEDAFELVPFTEHHALLSTRKGDELFDIAHFSNKDGMKIPLHLDTTLPGEYTISISDLNIPSQYQYVFTDQETGVTIPLNETFNYEFSIRHAAKSNPAPLTCGATGPELASKFKIEKAKSGGADRFIIQHASAVQDKETGESPTNFRLNQNYPNPFNPVTQISYELPQQSDVLLVVYDMTGRQIATLVNETVAAGSHQVSFDAGDLSSGIYLYRLTAGNQVFSRKLTVIK